jgi:hypothetical protein
MTGEGAHRVPAPGAVRRDGTDLYRRAGSARPQRRRGPRAARSAGPSRTRPTRSSTPACSTAWAAATARSAPRPASRRPGAHANCRMMRPTQLRSLPSGQRTCDVGGQAYEAAAAAEQLILAAQQVVLAVSRACLGISAHRSPLAGAGGRTFPLSVQYAAPGKARGKRSSADPAKIMNGLPAVPDQIAISRIEARVRAGSRVLEPRRAYW